MKCDDFGINLDDYEDDALEPPARADLESHLESCADCRREQELVRKEARLYAAHARAVEARLSLKPEVWGAIRSRIVNLRRMEAIEARSALQRAFSQLQGLSRMQQAGAALSLVLLVAVMGYLVMSSQAPSPPLGNAPPGAVASGKGEPSRDAGADGRAQVDSFQTVLFAIQQAERDYLDAIEMLRPTAEKRKAALDPQLQGAIERDMETIDQNLSNSRKAYKARPQDVDLARFMLSLYATKLELLQAITS